MKRIIPLILLVLFITSCGKRNDAGDMAGSNNQYGYSYQYLEEYEGVFIYEPTDYKNIIHDYNFYESDIIVELWTVNYESISNYYASDSLALFAYNYVLSKKDYFSSKLGFEIELATPSSEQIKEASILNIRNEAMDVYIIDLYLPLIFDSEYVLVPIKTYTLRGYENEIEDIDGKFISYNDFYEKYK